eukprot:11965710-Prorocentrum_lima.AAC.1
MSDVMATFDKKQEVRRIWEVFAGSSITSKGAARAGAHVQNFGFAPGWNFFREDHRRQFLEQLERERPHE